MGNEVSLCMIVKNEEKYLEKCLSSVKDIVDEIIIVDTGSTDNTVEIAKSFGAKIYYFPWDNNFSNARNESLKYASKDWILILDGDDELFPEDREKLKKFLNENLDEEAIYFFETLSYYGDMIDNSSITINLNPRLFINHQGTHYEGEIHNQLIYSSNKHNVICSSIKIHHYGYLSSTIELKKKRERNIRILEEQIKKHENDYFTYFNLGTEYAATGDIEKALSYFYRAYEGFQPEKGYGSLLILRIVILNYNLQYYEEAIKFIDIGLKYYSDFTDLYFLRALIFIKLGVPTSAIKALEKCVELGEPPSKLKCFYGVGTFKAYFELGNIYLMLKDYDTAYDCYVKSITLNQEFTNPLYPITHILKCKNISVNEIGKIIEGFLIASSKAYDLCADIFYTEGYYETALEYISKYEELGISTEKIIILKTKCLMMSGRFKECISIYVDDTNCFRVPILMYKVISYILINEYDKCRDVLSEIKYNQLLGYDKKLIKVYNEFLRLFLSEEISPIYDEEDTKDYLNIILEILEILLINEKFEEFKIAVNLLNLTASKQELLSLGKLYYKYGYWELAKKEVLRSIKEFEIYDYEGLEILKCV